MGEKSKLGDREIQTIVLRQTILDIFKFKLKIMKRVKHVLLRTVLNRNNIKHIEVDSIHEYVMQIYVLLLVTIFF